MLNQKTKLTKIFVDSLPLSSDKQIFYRDSELIGFALRVTTSKVYVVERRIGNGKSSIRVTVGRHGDITSAQARKKAQMLLAQMASGINPNHEKKKNKETNTLASNAIEIQQPTLLTAYTTYKLERKLAEKTLIDYQMCIDDYLLAWKEVKLIELTPKMIQEKHADLTVRSRARANLAMRFLRAVFNFSIQYFLDVNHKSILDIPNPVNILDVKKAWNKIKRRKSYIRKDQMENWINTVLSTEWVGQNYYNHNGYTNQDFLLVVLLTGFPREEIQRLRWKDVDLKYGTVTSVDPKNKESITLPMGPILKHIMQARFDRSGAKPFVFQARQGEGHVTNRSKARYKITELSGIEFTYHDLRRTFSILAHSINMSAYTTKRLSHHSLDESDVVDGDVHVSFEDMYLAMTKIEQAVFTDQQFEIIKNREFKRPTRHGFVA